MKFLAPSDDVPELSFGTAPGTMEIDHLDRQILCLLAEGAGATQARIARHLGAQHSTVAYRITRLHERRVILGAKYMVNLKAFGVQSFFHHVRLAASEPAIRREIFAFLRRHPCVFYVAHVIGGWDLDIESGAEDPAEVTQFTEDFVTRFPGAVLSISSCPLFEFKRINYFPFGQANGLTKGGAGRTPRTTRT